MPEIRKCDLPCPYFYKRPDYPAHHAPQKMRSGDSELDDILFSFNSRRLDVHDCRFVRTRRIRSAKTDEVMAPNQSRGRLGHLRNVQLLFDPPHVSFDEGLLPL